MTPVSTERGIHHRT